MVKPVPRKKLQYILNTVFVIFVDKFYEVFRIVHLIKPCEICLVSIEDRGMHKFAKNLQLFRLLPVTICWNKLCIPHQSCPNEHPPHPPHHHCHYHHQRCHYHHHSHCHHHHQRSIKMISLGVLRPLHVRSDSPL